MIEHETIQITLHGATYGHVYWDFPFQAWMNRRVGSDSNAPVPSPCQP